MSGLYLSASGISNALRRIDIRANNTANAATPGFREATPHSSETIGGGAAVDSVTLSETTGPLFQTGNPLDVAATPGYFQVRQPDGSLAYMRDGHFGLNAQGEVVTAEGSRLEPPVRVEGETTSVRVLNDGTLVAQRPDGLSDHVGQIEVFMFPNPAGLESLGGNAYAATAASGAAIPARAETQYYPGFVQGSNVNLARETIDRTLDMRAAEANMQAFRQQADILGELLDLEG